MSHTVAREALIRLEARGIVQVSARRRWFVIKPSFAKAQEAFDERCAIEKGVLTTAGSIGPEVVAAFRTDFRGPASMVQSRTQFGDYADTAGRSRAAVSAGHGKQRGDPARGARAIIAAVNAETSPVHLLIGGDPLVV